jgi:hypothetical protein
MWISRKACVLFFGNTSKIGTVQPGQVPVFRRILRWYSDCSVNEHDDSDVYFRRTGRRSFLYGNDCVEHCAGWLSR